MEMDTCPDKEYAVLCGRQCVLLTDLQGHAWHSRNLWLVEHEEGRRRRVYLNRDRHGCWAGGGREEGEEG